MNGTLRDWCAWQPMLALHDPLCKLQEVLSRGDGRFSSLSGNCRVAVFFHDFLTQLKESWRIVGFAKPSLCVRVLPSVLATMR